MILLQDNYLIIGLSIFISVMFRSYFFIHLNFNLLMTKFILITSCCLMCLSSFAQKEKKMKYRKLDYTDFYKYSINDTSNVIIDIFFDKKENTGIGQMSFLPVNLIVYMVSPPIGAALVFINFPLFLNGSRVLIKYRNKKLYTVLNDYKETGYIPKGIRKIVNKEFRAYELLTSEYY